MPLFLLSSRLYCRSRNFTVSAHDPCAGGLSPPVGNLRENASPSPEENLIFLFAGNISFRMKKSSLPEKRVDVFAGSSRKNQVVRTMASSANDRPDKPNSQDRQNAHPWKSASSPDFRLRRTFIFHLSSSFLHRRSFPSICAPYIPPDPDAVCFSALPGQDVRKR